MDALPLTPNGKLDRRALPETKGVRPEWSNDYIAPSTPAQKLLADIWKEVLNIEKERFLADRVYILKNLEEKYGHLAPAGGLEEPYTGFGGAYGGLFHERDRAFKIVYLKPVLTGNVRKAEFFNQDLGREIADVELEVVFRDSAGQLRRLFVSLGSEELRGDFNVLIKKGEDTFRNVVIALSNISELATPGRQITLNFLFDKPYGGKPALGCRYDSIIGGEFCTDNYRFQYDIFEQYREAIKAFGEALKEDLPIPELEEELVIFDNGVLLLDVHPRVPDLD